MRLLNVLNSHMISYDEIINEYTKRKEENSAKEQKYHTLLRLSSSLSARFTEAENAAQIDINDEKERRALMSKSYSTSLNSISTKLEQLDQRRTKIFEENISLKEQLKSLITEFEKLEKEHPEEFTIPDETPEQKEGEALEANTVDNNIKIEHPANETSIQEGLVEDENQWMMEEDLLSQVIGLQSVDDKLRSEVLARMETFHAYQNKLSKCNELFTEKQTFIGKI